MNRTMYIPKNAEKLTRTGINAEVYVYDTSNGFPAAAMFGGKRAKPDKQFYYRSVEARDTAISEYFDSQKAISEAKVTSRVTRNSFVHTLKVGDILRNSWGYDQTNVDFFQVVETVGQKSVQIRQIGGHYTESGCMSGSTVAVADSFIGEPMLKRVSKGNTVKIHSWGSWAYPYDGKPAYTSSYH